MDGIDTGAYLASLMGQPSLGPSSKVPPGNLDQQILAALKQAPAASAAVDPTSPQAYAQAAATGIAQSDANPTLQLGYSRGHILDTRIPIPQWLAQTLSGAGGEAVRLGQGVKQTLGMRTDPLLKAVSQQELSTPAGKVGGFLTDNAITAPIGGLTTSGLVKLGGVGAKIAGNAFGNAAVQGALQGAITAPPGQRLEGMGVGAALSPILPALGSGVGKLARGLTRTPDAQALLDRGVQLTPGQMNPGGWLNRVEQAVAPVLPFVGGKIAQARGAALPAVTRSILSDALAPGDTLGTGDLNALVDQMGSGFDNAYSQIHGFPVKPAQVNVKGPDVPLSQAFQQITSKSIPGLLDSKQQELGQNLQGLLSNTIKVAKQSGGMLSDHLQALRSSIRDAARDVSPVDNASRAQRSFWDQAQQAVTKALDSQLPPKAASLLKATDAQYAKFATVQNLVRAAGDKPVTLAQLSNAIKQPTPAKLYAAGGGWNRDLTKAAQSVLGGTVPLTGLTGAGIVHPIMRGAEGLTGGLIGSGGGVFGHPLGALGAAGGLGSLWGAYTRPALRAFAGQTAPQRAIQGLLQSIHPVAKEAIGRYARTGLLNGLLQRQFAPGGLLAAPDQSGQ